MKLTQDQIEGIYLLTIQEFSQRDIAKLCKHGRGTLAKYLEPKEMATQYFDREVQYEVSKIIHQNTIEIMKGDISLYKNLFIAIGIVFIIQNIIIYFF